MNRIARGPQLDFAPVEREVLARDRELDNAFSKDLQLMAIRNARRSAATGSRGSPSRTGCSTRRPAR